jgi:hypothetical protein
VGLASLDTTLRDLRLGNLQLALQLLGVRVANSGDGAIATGSGQWAVQPINRAEEQQNKPTGVGRTLVRMKPCVERPVATKATLVHSPRRGSDSGHCRTKQRHASRAFFSGERQERQFACG